MSENFELTDHIILSVDTFLILISGTYFSSFVLSFKTTLQSTDSIARALDNF